MNSLLDFDEINRFEADVAQNAADGKRTDEIVDDVLDYLLYCYALGVKQANADLFSDVAVDEDKANEAVWMRIDGEDFADRIFEYLYANDLEAVNKVIETECHRVYITGGIDTAQEVNDENGGTALPAFISEDDLISVSETPTASDPSATPTATSGRVAKRWQTRLDGRVRDTHQYLHGVEVDIDADFFTYDGDKAAGPGLFEKAQNNINCRCWLAFRRV